MKPTVAKYVCGRIDDIASEKYKAIHKEFKIPDVKLSGKERLRLVKNGFVTVKEGCRSIDKYDSIGNVFDFSKYESQDQYRPGHQKALDKVAKEVRRLKDEVWLGDESQAMELLRKFEETE